MNNLSSKFPLIKEIQNQQEVFWVNKDQHKILSSTVTKEDIADASNRLERFAPFLKIAFPETAEHNGIIESPLIDISRMKVKLQKFSEQELVGKLLLKCDSHLPISGSIKARGGIYEVLTIAESIAIQSGLLSKSDDYSALVGDTSRRLFSNYTIAVGSTGNLGLSIGIMGTKLGFKVIVHMSNDAKQWKKDLLREKGATVIEHKGDYEMAVLEGRKQAEGDPYCFFIDDENSKTLFLGYAVAAERLALQLKQRNIVVNEKHPLFVYLPCGVGGGPGGIAYGLKQIFAEDVHCFFAEPVGAPCMLLGVMTGMHNQISVHDIGLSGKTAADGLAVGRPSQLVSQIVGPLIDGIYTVNDHRLFKYLALLAKEEGINIEPSAAIGFHGFILAQHQTDIISRMNRESLNQATHIVWATGGSMVPKAEMNMYIAKGEKAL